MDANNTLEHSIFIDALTSSKLPSLTFISHSTLLQHHNRPISITITFISKYKVVTKPPNCPLPSLPPKIVGQRLSPSGNLSAARWCFSFWALPRNPRTYKNPTFQILVSLLQSHLIHILMCFQHLHIPKLSSVLQHITPTHNLKLPFAYSQSQHEPFYELIP